MSFSHILIRRPGGHDVDENRNIDAILSSSEQSRAAFTDNASRDHLINEAIVTVKAKLGIVFALLPFQVLGISRLLDPSRKFVIISARTGSGKSMISTIVSAVYNMINILLGGQNKVVRVLRKFNYGYLSFWCFIPNFF